MEALEPVLRSKAKLNVNARRIRVTEGDMRRSQNALAEAAPLLLLLSRNPVCATENDDTKVGKKP